MTYLEKVMIRRGHPKLIILDIAGFFGSYISFGGTIGLGRWVSRLRASFSDEL
jgi:hypothetical protein